MDKHPNMVIIPVIHITPKQTDNIVPFEVTSQQLRNPLTYREGQFICSPADISVNRKVDLQDAKVSEDI